MPRLSPSATPATQSEGGCHQVPRLPRETKADVAKCLACHEGGCQEGQVVCEQVVRGQVVCVCEEVVCEQVVCGQVV